MIIVFNSNKFALIRLDFSNSDHENDQNHNPPYCFQTALCPRVSKEVGKLTFNVVC